VGLVFSQYFRAYQRVKLTGKGSSVGGEPAKAFAGGQRRGDVPARPQGPQRWLDAEESDADDRLLVSLQAARAGNPVAFEAVYRTLTPRLLRYARGLVGQDAEDVLAEAWLQIVRDLAGFEGEWDAFRGWTTRIVRNRAIDHLRTSGRRPLVADPVDILFERAAAEDTEAAAAESVSTALAIELVASLPPDQAEAVLLRAVVGLDAKAAGAILGKRAGAVRVSAHRGLKTLAARLDAAAGNANRTPDAGDMS
jgi:RNA polymerase sigma-70 factor (ECF subfamily)